MIFLNITLKDKMNTDMITHKENSSFEWEWLVYVSFGKIKHKHIFINWNTNNTTKAI